MKINTFGRAPQGDAGEGPRGSGEGGRRKHSLRGADSAGRPFIDSEGPGA